MAPRAYRAVPDLANSRQPWCANLLGNFESWNMMTTHDSDNTWSRRRVLASLAGVAAVAPFVRGERRQTGDSWVLRHTSHLPSSHGLLTKVFPPWAEMVAARTQGRISWAHYVDGLLHGPLDGFKAVTADMTDYTHGYATYQPGSFHLTHGLQLPFLFPNSGVASLVSEELYPTYLKGEYERMQVYLAHCTATTAYDILSKTPVRAPSDLRGLKVRSTGGLMTEDSAAGRCHSRRLGRGRNLHRVPAGHHRCGGPWHPRHGCLSALRDRQLPPADQTQPHGHPVVSESAHLR